MNVENKYFDVIINGNSFRVVECSSKPKNKDSALATLAKIETVIRYNFEYIVDHQDEYSKLSKSDLLNFLKKKTSEIHTGYTEKQSKLNWLARKIFSKEKELKAIHTRIEHYASPPQLSPLPNDIIEKMSKYLEVFDIATLAQLNRRVKAHVGRAIVRRAREFGYEGRNEAEANEHLKNLFKAVNELATQKIISEKHIAYKKKSIFQKIVNSEKTLQNLQNLTTKDIFSILKSLQFYSPSFLEFRKAFNLQRKWEVTEIDSTYVRLQGGAALRMAAHHNYNSALELLLQHGAAPSIPETYNYGFSALHYAARAGNAESVELLLQHHARVDEQNYMKDTPLSLACSCQYYMPNPKVVELLLQHGSDPNIPVKYGYSSLHLAAIAGNADIVELLIKYGARVDQTNDAHSTALTTAFSRENNYNPNLKVIEILLQYGAAPDIPNRAGYTALHLAIKAGNADIVELLVKYGANPNISAYDGSTPLQLALKNQLPQIVSLLLNNGARA